MQILSARRVVRVMRAMAIIIMTGTDASVCVVLSLKNRGDWCSVGNLRIGYESGRVSVSRKK